MSAIGDLPAFPYSTPPTHRDGLGLTKRELFAAMAMAALMSADNHYRGAPHAAALAREAADALIAELAK